LRKEEVEMNKGEKKRNLVAVRLTDEEFEHLKYLADKDV
jgi:hypothetical protein